MQCLPLPSIVVALTSCSWVPLLRSSPPLTDSTPLQLLADSSGDLNSAPSAHTPQQSTSASAPTNSELSVTSSTIAEPPSRTDQRREGNEAGAYSLPAVIMGRHGSPLVFSLCLSVSLSLSLSLSQGILFLSLPLALSSSPLLFPRQTLFNLTHHPARPSPASASSVADLSVREGKGRRCLTADPDDDSTQSQQPDSARFC
jgi:hypothetical protein